MGDYKRGQMYHRGYEVICCLCTEWTTLHAETTEDAEQVAIGFGFKFGTHDGWDGWACPSCLQKEAEQNDPEFTEYQRLKQKFAPYS